MLRAQVSHVPEAVAAVETVQAAMTACDEALATAFVDPCSAHITLAVVCLETPEDIQRAKLALRDARCKHGLRNGTARRTFGLSGLGHFKNQVLFVRVVPDDTLLVLESLSASVRYARAPSRRVCGRAPLTLVESRERSLPLLHDAISHTGRASRSNSWSWWTAKPSPRT